MHRGQRREITSGACKINAVNLHNTILVQSLTEINLTLLTFHFFSASSASLYLTFLQKFLILYATKFSLNIRSGFYSLEFTIFTFAIAVIVLSRAYNCIIYCKVEYVGV